MRDPVREEKSLPSRRKPRTAIRAGADWKCWTFPKSRASICQSPMSSSPPSSVTGVRSRRRRSIHGNLGVAEEGRLCRKGVSHSFLERYAMCSARWIQCEEMTNRMGFLSKHPTTQKPIPSPFINIGINYMNQAVRLWNEIFQIVKGKLQHRLRGGFSPGRSDGAPAPRKEGVKPMFEKVNPCHPDKVADRIAGALVDAAYRKEENPRIAVEVLHRPRRLPHHRGEFRTRFAG